MEKQGKELVGNSYALTLLIIKTQENCYLLVMQKKKKKFFSDRVFFFFCEKNTSVIASLIVIQALGIINNTNRVFQNKNHV